MLELMYEALFLFLRVKTGQLDKIEKSWTNLLESMEGFDGKTRI